MEGGDVDADVSGDVAGAEALEAIARDALEGGVDEGAAAVAAHNQSLD
jgi:hypothetical protein